MGTFGVYVVVQFYPWFNFYFLLFQTHYHTIPYPKTKQNVKWLKVDTVITNESVLLTFGECAACNTASSTFPSSNNWNENNNSFSKKKMLRVLEFKMSSIIRGIFYILIIHGLCNQQSRRFAGVNRHPTSYPMRIFVFGKPK